MTIVSDLLYDARHTLRQLRHSPFFSLTVILTLALSVGATAALTGVLRATLLHSLPYPQSNQLVEIGDQNLHGFKSSGMVSVPRTRDLAEMQANGRDLFSSLGFYYYDDSTITLNNQTSIHVPASAVSGTFFSTIAAAPLLGRTLTPADDVLNGPQLIVLSYHLWQTKFAADPTVIGRTIRLGIDQATIVGVMPKSFDLPSGDELWHPGHVFPSSFGSYRGDGGRFVRVIARIAPGQTVESARIAVAQLAARLAKEYPGSDAIWGFKLETLRDSLFGSVRQALLLIAAAVILVLLVAAVNIAGLQLSRNAARAQEFSIRVALGITRGRLTRQLFTESLLLVLIGSLAGVALAAALLKAVSTQLPSTLLLIEEPHVDVPVLSIALLVGFAVALFTAALPILQAARQAAPRSSRALVSNARRMSGKFAGKSFAAAQIAFSLVLLTLSASVLQNLYSLLTTPLGFDATNLQTLTVDFPWNRKREDTRRLYAQLEQSFAAIPGVASVGAMSALPFSPYSVLANYDIAGEAITPHHDTIAAEYRSFSLGYLRTMHIPLLAGRDFTAQDAEPGAPSVILINQTLAHRYFSTRNPVGRHLIGVDLSGPTSSEIVGIIGNVHGTGGAINVPLEPEVYKPIDGGWPHVQFVIRSTLPPSTLEHEIRRIVSSSSSIATIGNITSLSATVEKTLIQPRLNASLLTAFAALSLFLVIIGIYGLIAFDVAQRTRELGLRIALGSTRGGVISLLLSESLKMLTIGVAFGIGGSVFASRLLAATVFGMKVDHSVLLLITTAILTLAVLAATLIPASRAANVNPNEALRTE
ncbi:MAG: ABC transporter permease [Acidobacteriaceae bacterium]